MSTPRMTRAESESESESESGGYRLRLCLLFGSSCAGKNSGK
jgi:hypothetical protein